MAKRRETKVREEVAGDALHRYVLTEIEDELAPESARQAALKSALQPARQLAAPSARKSASKLKRPCVNFFARKVIEV